LRAVVRALNEQFLRNLRAGDVDALVDSFYAEDARVLPPNKPMVEGRAAIRELWRGALGRVGDMTLETVDVQTSGDLAYEVGRFTMGGATGKYLVVLRRQTDGSWKAAADMFSRDSE
jgi:ketosteroid isomerase-like protein